MMISMIIIISMLHQNADILLPACTDVLTPVIAETALMLEHPQTLRFREDRAWKTFREAVSFASDWPHERFRAPALEMLNSPNPSIVLSGACILVNYDDQDIKKRLEALTSDQRTTGGERVSALGRHVERYLEDAARGIMPFKPVPQLLLVNELGINLWYIGTDMEDSVGRNMNVPTAIQQLREDSLSVRLQACLWLACGPGIVLDTGPLEEAWPQLTYDLKKEVLFVLNNESYRVGGNQLREFFEIILDDWGEIPNDEIRGYLLELLGQLGSSKARERAKLIIQEYIRDGKHPQSEVDSETLASEQSLIHYAFLALSAEASITVREDALEWANSDENDVRLGGLCVLAGMDDWLAAYAVTGYLAALKTRPGDLNPADWLTQRDWHNKEIKWHYLRAINRILQADLRRISGDKYDNRKLDCPSLHLINLLEAIAQTTQGPNGRRLPNVTSVYLSETRETARKWDAWIKASDPQTSTHTNEE